MRLRRMRRRFSSSSAAMAGEISDAPNSGSVADRSCAKLAFVILRCVENVHQLFVSDVIPVLVEFLVGCCSRPACLGVLDVLRDFNEGTLCGDVAFRGACDQATDHGLQRRHFRDCLALTDGKRTIEFPPDERLGTLSFVALAFSRWIARLPFAETGVNRRLAVSDRVADLSRRVLFLCAHRSYSSAAAGGAARSCAISSKLILLAAEAACLPVTRSNR